MSEDIRYTQIETSFWDKLFTEKYCKLNIYKKEVAMCDWKSIIYELFINDFLLEFWFNY